MCTMLILRNSFQVLPDPLDEQEITDCLDLQDQPEPQEPEVLPVVLVVLGLLVEEVQLVVPVRQDQLDLVDL